MKILTGLLVALVASPAAAQSVAGVQLGDTLESVRPRYAGNYTTIQGKPGASLINREGGYILFCNERVTAMQERVGRDLHVFTDMIVEGTAAYGEPTWVSRNVQSTSGEISTLEARWQFDGYRYAVGYLYGLGALDVTRSYTVPDTCGT